MKYIKLFTDEDKKSYFIEVDAGFAKKHPSGNYSKKYFVKEMMFRDFEKDSLFDWHTAPEPQYIVYLEGKCSFSFIKIFVFIHPVVP